MSIFEGFDFWRLLAGLAIFQFGLYLMEESVRKLSGKAFKLLIRKYTTGRIRSVISGAFTTAILQSSTAISLMTLAFVGAGIMTMENGLGVIFGANIGTTVTGWLVATLGFKLDVESLALPLIGIGGLGVLLLSNYLKFLHLSRFLIGFGLLLLGLDFMKVSVETLATQFDITQLQGFGISIYVLIAMVLTAIMQSSTAMMAIVLTALHARIFEFDVAVAMVIGANVGTTITVLLGAIGTMQVKKRVAYGNFFFNLISAIIALLFLPLILRFILNVCGLQNDPMTALALFHTVFNILGVLAFIPFLHVFTQLLTRLFPDRKTTRTLFINNMPTDEPDAAISSMKKEIIHLIHDVLRHNMVTLSIDEKLVIPDNSYPQLQKVNDLTQKYENLKLLQAEIFTFAASIQKHALSEEEANILNRYLHAARMALYSAKTLKDVKHNLEDFEITDNLFLSAEYAHFRKRLIDAYLDIDRILSNPEDKNIIGDIFKLFTSLQNSDKEFIDRTVQAVNSSHIKDIDVSTAVVVNKALYQSSRQSLTAVRDLMLSTDELQHFEKIQDITEES